MTYFIYIMASKKNGTLYIGVTRDLVKRLWEHKNKTIEGFTEHYAVNRLVYFESTPDIESAINREKQLKAWRRSWKIALIEESNPFWKDLYPEII